MGELDEQGHVAEGAERWGVHGMQHENDCISATTYGPRSQRAASVDGPASGSAPGPRRCREIPGMAAIRFFDPSATEFMKPVDVYPDSLKERLTEAEVADTSVGCTTGFPASCSCSRSSSNRASRSAPMRTPTTRSSPSSKASCTSAGACAAGLVVLLPGNTLYGFRAGPDGCRYLDFRAEADSTYFDKDDIVEARAGSPRPARRVRRRDGLGQDDDRQPGSAALRHPFVDNDVAQRTDENRRPSSRRGRASTRCTTPRRRSCSRAGRKCGRLGDCGGRVDDHERRGA